MKDFIFTWFVLNFFVQISGAKFGDDVSIIFGCINFVQGEYIWDRLEFFKDINF